MGSHPVAQCKNKHFKCVNCEGDHNALALKCRKRKEVIAQKIKDLKREERKKRKKKGEREREREREINR